MALTFPDDWTEELLQQYYKQAKTSLAARRYHALLLCIRSYKRQEVAQIVGVSRRTLVNWINQAVTEGLESLSTRKYGGGYPSKLSAAQQIIVDMWVEDEPTTTLVQLQNRIAERWQISLSLPQVSALLKKLGYRRITPRKRHYQTDLESQESFKKKLLSGLMRLKEVSATSYSVMKPGSA